MAKSPNKNKYSSIPRTGLRYPKVVYTPPGTQSYYDPHAETIYAAVGEDPSIMQHEMFHHWQNLNKDLQVGPVRDVPITAENPAEYYNRRQADMQDASNKFLKRNPSFLNIPLNLLYNKEVEPSMYYYPEYAEGEAEEYENYVQRGGQSVFPEYAKGGPVYNWIPEYPRTGAKYAKGGWLEKYADGSTIEDQRIPTPTTPSYYPDYPDRTLTNYQMGTPKAPMYAHGATVYTNQEAATWVNGTEQIGTQDTRHPKRNTRTESPATAMPYPEIKITGPTNPYMPASPPILQGYNPYKGPMRLHAPDTLRIGKVKKAEHGGFVEEDQLQNTNPILSNIYKKYPAFKNLGPVTLKADPSFVKDKTGVGEIEYFSPTQDTVRYSTGYNYPHPNFGTHGIVYNPNINNAEEAIRLDLLHGMPISDKVYAKHRQEFGEAFKKANQGDIDYWWSKEKEKYGEGDGKEAFEQNYIDGVVRGLMLKGDLNKMGYSTEANEFYLQNPEINKRTKQIENYLQIGQGYMLPEVEIIANKHEHGSYVTNNYKKRAGIPYAINPGISDAGMYVGPTTQRGITFGNGGNVPPLYVSNPNDPRLKSYNDSLALFKSYGIAMNKLKKDLKAEGRSLKHIDIIPFKSSLFVDNYKDDKILPIGFSRDTEAVDFPEYTWTTPIYKQPVQPVIYQPTPPVRNKPATSSRSTYSKITKMPMRGISSVNTEKAVPQKVNVPKTNLIPTQYMDTRGEWSSTPQVPPGYTEEQLLKMGYRAPQKKANGGWLDSYEEGGEVDLNKPYLNPATVQSVLAKANQPVTTTTGRVISTPASREKERREKIIAKDPSKYSVEDYKQGIKEPGADNSVLSDPIAMAAALTAGGVGLGAYGLSQVPRMFLGNLASEATMGLSDLTKVGIQSAKPVINTAKNLEDLKAAQEFAQQYGYSLPTNIERIAQSNMLTDKVIRGMMDRHNTFVRGVSTNWNELQKRLISEHGADKGKDLWNGIVQNFEAQGIDYINNPKAAAEYMATHIPISTGYGRASLNRDVFDQGLEGLYTSNSMPTAEGYTYGQGFITKGKKPTNYSSSNRQDWITQNNPQYYEHNLPGGNTLMVDGKVTHPINMKLPYLYSVKDYDNINVFKNTVIKDLEKQAASLKEIFEEKAITNPQYSQNMKNSYDEIVKRIEDIKAQKWENTDVKFDKKLLKTENINKTYLESINEENIFPEQFLNRIGVDNSTKIMIDITKKVRSEYAPKIFKIEEDILALQSKYPKLSTGERLGELEYAREFSKLADEHKTLLAQAKEEVKEKQLQYLKDNYPDELNMKDRFAHYIHLGTPGEKILEPIKSWEVTPEIWKNKSRGHTNKYSEKLSAMKNGGIVSPNKYKQGGWLDNL